MDARKVLAEAGMVRTAGRATTMGNTTYHYNANGSSAGRATTVGNTTYFYNANGSAAGTATKIGK